MDALCSGASQTDYTRLAAGNSHTAASAGPLMAWKA